MKQRGMAKKVSASTFGALLAVMVIPTAVAQADQTDQDFNSYLQSHGINLGNASQTLNMAHMMCQDLNAGYTQKDEVDQLTGAHRLNEAQAEVFVGAATADYCPGKHSPTKPAAK